MSSFEGFDCYAVPIRSGTLGTAETEAVAAQSSCGSSVAEAGEGQTVRVTVSHYSLFTRLQAV